MAYVQKEQLVNASDFRTGTRTDGSKYVYKINDCGSTDCKYSVNYVPPNDSEKEMK